MSGVRTALSGAADRLLARRQDPRDGYAFCSEDRFWFRPAYTEGKCPLCSAVAPGGAPPPPLLAQMDRSWLGLALLMLVSMAMSALVLLAYLKG